MAFLCWNEITFKVWKFLTAVEKASIPKPRHPSCSSSYIMKAKRTSQVSFLGEVMERPVEEQWIHAWFIDVWFIHATQIMLLSSTLVIFASTTIWIVMTYLPVLHGIMFTYFHYKQVFNRPFWSQSFHFLKVRTLRWTQMDSHSLGFKVRFREPGREWDAATGKGLKLVHRIYPSDDICSTQIKLNIIGHQLSQVLPSTSNIHAHHQICRLFSHAVATICQLQGFALWVSQSHQFPGHLRHQCQGRDAQGTWAFLHVQVRRFGAW